MSAFLFGLPHGAYDFWILRKSASLKGQSFRKLFLFLAAYLLLAISVVVVWYFLPGVVLIGFLALTAWHFGSGDAIWEADNRLDWIIQSLGRGVLVMSAPPVFYPFETRQVLARLDYNSTEILLIAAPYFLVFGIFVTVSKTVIAVLRNSLSQILTPLLTLLETCILLLFFWLTTPLLALTVYLVGVHSWRHLLRVRIYEKDEQSFQPVETWQFIRSFHLRTLPITLISIIGSAAIFWWLNLQFSDFANYTTAYLVLLSALTLPHATLIGLKEFNL